MKKFFSLVLALALIAALSAAAFAEDPLTSILSGIDAEQISSILDAFKEEFQGNMEEMTAQVREVLDMMNSMTDDELKELIRAEAAARNISIPDVIVDKVISLICAMDKLDDADLSDKIESTLGSLEKFAKSSEIVTGFAKKASGFFGGISDFFASLSGD